MTNVWSSGARGAKAPAAAPGSPASAPHGNARAAKLLPGLVAAAFLVATGAPALAEPPCVREAERVAFDVRALQSQLMVVALVCERQDDYNAFVRRHRRGLVNAYQEMTSHFHRLHGADEGEEQRDTYITELANAQSHAGTRQGRAFCRNMESFVERALALRDTGEIARLSVAAQVATPSYAPASCAVSEASATTAGAGAEERKLDARELRGAAHGDEARGLSTRLDRLEQMLERMLERQPDPVVRPVAARHAARKER